MLARLSAAGMGDSDIPSGVACVKYRMHRSASFWCSNYVSTDWPLR